MILNIIVAVGENNEIGKDNALLWHMPADLKHFKLITSGFTVIMGRRTFESIGKPLPNRRNIVITSRDGFPSDGITLASSFEDALEKSKSETEVFILGGARVFKDALPLSKKLYLTKVDHAFPDADTYFPDVDLSEWELDEKHPHKADEKNAFDYTFYTYRKK